MSLSKSDRASYPNYSTNMTNCDLKLRAFGRRESVTSVERREDIEQQEKNLKELEPVSRSLVNITMNKVVTTLVG